MDTGFHRANFFRSGQVWLCGAASVLLALGAGCSHHQVAYAPPPPPAPAENPPAATTTQPTAPVTPAKPEAATGTDDEYVATHAPIFTQTGMASWYGPPYHNRTGANGTVYNEHHLSAAHRT